MGQHGELGIEPARPEDVPAIVALYGKPGTVAMGDWTVYRVAGYALEKLASKGAMT